MKFKAPFLGVPNGEIYPVEYKAGDQCPPELQEAAESVGALETKAKAPVEEPKGKAKAK